MPSLNKIDLKKAQRILKEGQELVKPSRSLRKLMENYDIGKPVSQGWRLSATDRKRLREVIVHREGIDPLSAVLEGSRIDLAEQGAFNEKLGTKRPLGMRVVCTALHAPVVISGNPIIAVPGVEYRVDYREIDLERYAALLIIENHEVFLSAHRLALAQAEPVLVAYRGHDHSLRATQSLLQHAARQGMKTVWSSDGDPSGIHLTLASGASHALLPCQDWVDAQADRGEVGRAAGQLAQSPHLPGAVRDDGALTAEFRRYASWILEGRAFTEERWIAQGVLMRAVPIRG